MLCLIRGNFSRYCCGRLGFYHALSSGFSHKGFRICQAERSESVSRKLFENAYGAYEYDSHLALPALDDVVDFGPDFAFSEGRLLYAVSDIVENSRKLQLTSLNLEMNV